MIPVQMAFINSQQTGSQSLFVNY